MFDAALAWAHAQQPLKAFFYKINDVHPSKGSNPDDAFASPNEQRSSLCVRTQPHVGPRPDFCGGTNPNATKLFVDAMLKQTCLYNKLTKTTDRVATVGLDLSDHAWLVDKKPFFCDEGLDYGCN